MRFSPRQDPARAARWRALGHWNGETMFDLLAAQAARTPGQTAITDGTRNFMVAADEGYSSPTRRAKSLLKPGAAWARSASHCGKPAWNCAGVIVASLAG